MPVKWTLENDHMLLLKLLETNPGFSVDGKKIAAAWPTDRGEVPTPRAITEHIITIRKKADGGNTPGASVRAPRVKKPTSPNSTPTKRRRRTTANQKPGATTPAQTVKPEFNSDSLGDEEYDYDLGSSPTKKARASSAAARRKAYEGDESDELGSGNTTKRFGGIVV